MSLPNPYDDPGFYEHLIGKRLLAWVIDLVVTLALVLVVLALTVFLTILIFPIVWAAVAIAYRTVMLSRYGATLGMMVAAIKLRRLDATRADALQCFWHSVIYAASMTLVLPQIGSVALMLITPYKQGLNDFLLGTTLVNKFL
ncbi:RDD family protein [Pararhodobacter sp.]|uniref:RDD family protein n=1 Tax=Pararhodobacter sp. TaxID=2127056 RepID=UPI002AFEAD25|nr:RDD family protein [Pararhodobacter sp.]